MAAPLIPTYLRAPVGFVKGEGCELICEDKERYLDCASGIAVCALGHCHPRLVEVLQHQAAQLWHTSNLYRIPLQEQLARRLCGSTYQAFFTNSGAEALEGALKLARRHAHAHGRKQATVLTVQGGFHGRTLATIAAAHNPAHTQGFAPLPGGFRSVPFADQTALEEAMGPEVAALLLEPVQGDGGIVVHDKATLRHAQALCRKHGCLLIVDEVQCGMGRTGKLWAHQWSGVTPDIIATAKGLGGGFPVGAVLARKEVAEALGPGSHGSTFGGNPLAMAVANTVVEIIDTPAFLEDVQAKGALFQQALQALAQRHNLEVRGMGLMLGLRCPPTLEARSLVQACLEQKLLTAPASNHVVRLLPPLVITPDEIRRAVAALDAALLACDGA